MSGTPALVILVAAILTNNILLANFLGMCSFLVCSRQLATALGLGAAVTFVMSFTTVINYAIYHGILVAGAPLCRTDLTHLNYIIFIAVIAAFVQFVEMFIERTSPVLHYRLGIFLPLITVNCAILGAALFMVIRDYGFWQTLAYGVGSGLGWTLAITLMAGMRQRIRFSHIPEPLQGVAITMIITGVMAMAFMGFAGMVNIQ